MQAIVTKYHGYTNTKPSRIIEWRSRIHNRERIGDSMNTTYIETDCTIEYQGKEFTSGGAIVTDQYCIGYLKADGTLTDWHGNYLGTYRIVSTWRTPRSYVSSTMHQVEAKVNGIVYTGRSCGVGMFYKGKRMAKQ